MGSTTFDKPLDNDVAELNDGISVIDLSEDIVRDSTVSETWSQKAYKIGRIVICEFNGRFASTTSGDAQLFHGLPAPLYIVHPTGAYGASPTDYAFRMMLKLDGKLCLDGAGSVGDKYFNFTFAYISAL